jgi:hypothetical protein
MFALDGVKVITSRAMKLHVKLVSRVKCEERRLNEKKEDLVLSAPGKPKKKEPKKGKPTPPGTPQCPLKKPTPPARPHPRSPKPTLPG